MKRTLNRWTAILSALCMAVLLLLPCRTALAGTSEIHVDTEEGGEVVMGAESAWSGTPGNTRGALFWNGTTWVSNDTAAHMYFSSVETGLRLMNYIDTAIPATVGTETHNEVSFASEEYNYQVTAADGSGTYRYTGIKYTITQADGKKAILLSRGLGRGTGVSYLEVFMENQTTGTLAVRPGSVLYGSAGTADEAAALDNPTTGVMGLLRTADVYWFDRDGGSDMGGFTYSPHTEARPASLVVVSHPLLTNQVVRLDLMLRSTDNLLYRYILEPALISETFDTTLTVVTSAVTGATSSSATLGGSVTSSGPAITERGFVYGAAADPAIGGAGVTKITANGTGTGSFSATLSGLAASTPYHVRAYAINSEGTSYGEDRTFTTSSGGFGGVSVPSVETVSVSDITPTGAALAGRVFFTGSGTVTARGFVIGITPNPVLGGEGVINIPVSGSTGSFTARADSLLPGTTYYVRAYAVNSAGVAYGAVMSFKMAADIPDGIPQTGDGRGFPSAIGMIAAGVLGISLLLLRRKKKRT